LVNDQHEDRKCDANDCAFIHRLKSFHRIVSTRMPRVTTTDPTEAAGNSSEDAVSPNRGSRVC
jgi:hypothetical protein